MSISKKDLKEARSLLGQQGGKARAQLPSMKDAQKKGQASFASRFKTEEERIEYLRKIGAKGRAKQKKNKKKVINKGT